MIRLYGARGAPPSGGRPILPAAPQPAHLRRITHVVLDQYRLGRARQRGLAQHVVLDRRRVGRLGLAAAPAERGRRDEDAGPRPDAPVGIDAHAQAQAMPSRRAKAVAAERDDTPSLPKMLLRCRATVFSLNTK